jgi:hypothetical protein
MLERCLGQQPFKAAVAKVSARRRFENICNAYTCQSLSERTVARLLFTEDTLHLVEVLYARTLVPGGIGVARPPHGSKDRCGLVRR